MYIDVHEAQQ